MDRKEKNKERVAQVSRDMGRQLRRQARSLWEDVRTAERNESGRHVWRFRTGAAQSERFLHVEHRAMMQNGGGAKRLLDQLTKQGWLDRLRTEESLILSVDGQLATFPRG